MQSTSISMILLRKSVNTQHMQVRSYTLCTLSMVLYRYIQ